MSNVLQFPDSPEIATRMCFALADNLGRILAKQITAKVAANDLSRDEMDEAINAAMRDARSYFATCGADASDINTICDAIYASLVKEGEMLSRMLHWEGGHA